MTARSKLAWKYFLSAILLFGAGYTLAWFSEQTVFSKAVFPKHAATAKPAATTSPTPVPNDKASTKPGRTYVVQPGDTISGIAQANGISFEELAQYNNIPYPYNLVDGQEITIPGK